MLPFLPQESEFVLRAFFQQLLAWHLKQTYKLKIEY